MFKVASTEIGYALRPMLDWIALFISHSLIALAFWRLMNRADTDDEAAPDRRHRPAGFGQPGTTPERPAYDGPDRRGSDAPPPQTGWRGPPSQNGWHGDA